MEEYYKLKRDYEQRIYKKAKKIKGDDTLDFEERREKLSNIIPKCINCSQPGGTIFTETYEELRATCGNKDKPCDLDIRVSLEHSTSIVNLYKLLKRDLEKIKQKIITIKLDLLYGIKSQSEIMEKFQRLNKRFSDKSKFFDEISELYYKIITNSTNKAKLNKTETKLQKNIDAYKLNLEEYKEEGTYDNLNEAFKYHTRRVMKLAKNARLLKYNTNTIEVEIDENKVKTYYLHQYAYDIDNLEIPIK